MKRRTKKVLSLLLAASMVFTMNTIAFGEEIVAEDVAADDVAVETVVEGAADADLADAEVADAELAGAMVKDDDGIGLDAEGKVVTKITFESDGAKKNEKFNVAVIENTTNPISWNNYYAADLMETVFSGELNKDNYLNNRKETSVSSSSPLHPNHTVDGEEGADAGYFYQSYAVNEADGIYLLVKYGLGGQSMYVKGYDSFNEPEYTDLLPTDDSDGATSPATMDAYAAYQMKERIEKLPVTTWDGRKVAWNKDSKGVMTKSAKNVLDVTAALVKYEGNTVKEFPGVEVGSVKIDTKAIKNASVKAKPSQTKISCKYLDAKSDPAKEVTAGVYVDEHDTINTIPTFTFTVKTKNKDLKAYKKDITAATKAVGPLAFGIVQATLTVVDPIWTYDANGDEHNDYGAFANEFIFGANKGKHYAEVLDDDKTVAKDYNHKDSYVIAASGNEVADDKGNGIEKEIDDSLAEDGYFDDVEHTDPIALSNGFKISKFGKDGKKATLTKTVDTLTAKGVEGTADVNIKFAKAGSTKGDFTLTKGTLAGKDVYVLDFIENGNIAYAETDPVQKKNDLSAFSFKYAFRPSPVEGSKAYREGIFANTDEGFVFNAQ